jgi:hypothetical protein
MVIDVVSCKLVPSNCPSEFLGKRASKQRTDPKTASVQVIGSYSKGPDEYLLPSSFAQHEPDLPLRPPTRSLFCLDIVADVKCPIRER